MHAHARKETRPIVHCTTKHAPHSNMTRVRPDPRANGLRLGDYPHTKREPAALHAVSCHPRKTRCTVEYLDVRRSCSRQGRSQPYQQSATRARRRTRTTTARQGLGMSQQNRTTQGLGTSQTTGIPNTMSAASKQRGGPGHSPFLRPEACRTTLPRARRQETRKPPTSGNMFRLNANG